MEDPKEHHTLMDQDDAVTISPKCDQAKQLQNDDYFGSEKEKCMQGINLKDAGYAWIILAAMTISNIFTAGYVKSFGMMSNAILDILPVASGASTGLLLGLLVGCRSIFALAVGSIQHIIGFRYSIFIGCLLCSGGLFLSIFCNSVTMMAVTLGAITGTGICLVELPQVVVLSEYFKEKLAFANGVRVSGNPIGGMLYPFYLVLLLEGFGLKMTLLLLSATLLHIFICGLIIRPPHIYRRICFLEYINKQSSERDYVTNKAEKKRVLSALMARYESGNTDKKQLLNFKILINPVFWVFLALVTGASFSLPLIIYFLPIYGKSIGLSPYENSVLLFIQSVDDVLFRLAIGWIGDKKLITKQHGFSVCLLLGGAGTVLTPLAKDLWSLVATSTLFTLGSASYFAYSNVILSEQFGKENIAVTYGCMRTLQGALNFVTPSIVGHLVDVTGGYTVPFIVMGSGLIFAAVVLLLEPLIIKFTNSDVIIT